GEGLTPYQGKERAYGKLKCPSCGRQWSSNNTHADTYQLCANCKTEVFPYKQVSNIKLHCK
ncbi:hypothetical protein CAPTEDRAFT_98311, partial [Capitella teleta]